MSRILAALVLASLLAGCARLDEGFVRTDGAPPLGPRAPRDDSEAARMRERGLLRVAKRATSRLAQVVPAQQKEKSSHRPVC